MLDLPTSANLAFFLIQLSFCVNKVDLWQADLKVTNVLRREEMRPLTVLVASVMFHVLVLIRLVVRLPLGLQVDLLLLSE